MNHLWEVRDSNHNTLFKWHYGANAFLYQADHLEMHGDATSPRAGVLEQLAALGQRCPRQGLSFRFLAPLPGRHHNILHAEAQTLTQMRLAR